MTPKILRDRRVFLKLRPPKTGHLTPVAFGSSSVKIPTYQNYL